MVLKRVPASRRNGNRCSTRILGPSRRIVARTEHEPVGAGARTVDVRGIVEAAAEDEITSVRAECVVDGRSKVETRVVGPAAANVEVDVQRGGEFLKGGWHGDGVLDGGTLFTQFSHFIDIMYWLFGDITNIRGNFADFNHQNLTDFEDSGVVTFDFINGGMGCLNYSTSVWDKNLESAITIIGEKGTVKVAGQYMNEVTYCHVKDYVMPELAPSNPPNDYGLYKGSAQNHHYVIQNVVEKLNNKRTITTNVLEGLKVVDIIERIYQVRDQQWKKKR